MFDSLKQALCALHDKKISSVELTTHYIEKITQAKALNAFINIDEEYSLIQAKAADNKLASGLGKRLTGLPVAHKDIFCTHHFPTTCGSKMLEHFKSPYQATVVQNIQNEGAVVLGKTNMDEFAMGSSNENSFFGPVKNPWDIERVPGGSSGGAAAAVAAGLTPWATGSDTGGSIRQPAALCGISGIKPTYGLASRFGMVAYASSLDQAGPLARTVEDLALCLQTMVGFDPKDSTSLNKTVPDYTAGLPQSIRGLRIGLPSSFFYSAAIDPAILLAIEAALAVLKKAGAIMVDLDLPLQNVWVPCYYIVACAEASSNLSRFDGIRFGHRSLRGSTLQEQVTASRTEGFGEEVKRRILTGAHVLSSGYFDAYYLQALKIRRMIQQELKAQLKNVDLILGPTTPACAFKIGEHAHDPIQNYLADMFTVGANLAGLPALSLPVGFKGHLPIGMQLMGNHFSEALLLNVGHQYQTMTAWHQHIPPYPTKEVEK